MTAGDVKFMAEHCPGSTKSVEKWMKGPCKLNGRLIVSQCEAVVKQAEEDIKKSKKRTEPLKAIRSYKLQECGCFRHRHISKGERRRSSSRHNNLQLWQLWP